MAAALAWHNGDAEATIRTLIADCKHLREQLALAQIGMNMGFTRGWSPCAERKTTMINEQDADRHERALYEHYCEHSGCTE